MLEYIRRLACTIKRLSRKKNIVLSVADSPIRMVNEHLSFDHYFTAPTTLQGIVLSHSETPYPQFKIFVCCSINSVVHAFNMIGRTV